MRVVAGGTFPRFYRGMDKSIFHFFGKKFMAFQTKLPPGAGLQMEFVLGGTRRPEEKGDDPEEQEEPLNS